MQSIRVRGFVLGKSKWQWEEQGKQQDAQCHSALRTAPSRVNGCGETVKKRESDDPYYCILTTSLDAWPLFSIRACLARCALGCCHFRCPQFRGCDQSHGRDNHHHAKQHVAVDPF